MSDFLGLRRDQSINLARENSKIREGVENVAKFGQIVAMQDEWQLQDAGDRLSEVVEQACSEGVQTLTEDGEPVAVVLSAEEYARLKNPTVEPKKKRRSLVEILQDCPSPEIFQEIANNRVQSPVRSIDLD